MGVLLVAVFSVNISSTRASFDLQARNELVPEVQIAQNYMLSKLREATYIYPYGTVLNLGTSASVKNPSSGSGSWTVGTDPIVAVVLPPRTLAATCALTSTIDNCYTFYAYFPVKRSDLVSATDLGSLGRPVADPLNDGSAWVLMEYRRTLGTQIPTSSAVAFGAPATDTKATVVLDYLQPVPLPQSGTNVLFSQSNDAMPQLPGITSITLNLASRRIFQGRTLNVPGADRYTVTVYPRNINKPTGPN